MLKVSFIGAGTVGTALAVLMNRKGYQVVGIYSRSRTSSEKLANAIHGCRIFDSSQSVAESAELIFISTPDSVIPSIVSQVSWTKGMSVVHCSGADSTDVLEPARRSGAAVGSFHPLQTFAGVTQAIKNIPGSTFAIEGEEPLLNKLKEIATALGGHWIKLEAGDKVAYHAAAVIACNYLVTLVKMSTDLWQTFSIPSDQAIQALLPLIRGTLHNIETIGIPQCLTGPISRGDTGTVEKHIAALQEKAPELLFAYKELGLQTIPIAEAKGKISKDQANDLDMILKST